LIEISVSLGDRSYPILIGRNLLSNAKILGSVCDSKRALVVSNETVANLYFDKLERSAKSENIQLGLLLIGDGEEFKSRQTLDQIYLSLLEGGYDRGSSIIALGGGVVGDIAGFAAATYQRGISYIQMPTTLLAQVDSSVGGKTGINHPMGKNMIGAFYQPKAVVIDSDTLVSLPSRQISAGLAEVIKYGIIHDKEFFSFLETNIESLVSGDQHLLMFAIEKSCKIKAEIVGQDEREKGKRALLNFGHTFGHAIEVDTNYKKFLHGEAVAQGCVLASRLSQKLGLIGRKTEDRISELLSKAKLPVIPPKIGVGRYLELMRRDKKSLDGVIRLILINKIGGAFISSDYKFEILTSVLEEGITK